MAWRRTKVQQTLPLLGVDLQWTGAVRPDLEAAGRTLLERTRVRTMSGIRRQRRTAVEFVDVLSILENDGVFDRATHRLRSFRLAHALGDAFAADAPAPALILELEAVPGFAAAVRTALAVEFGAASAERALRLASLAQDGAAADPFRDRAELQVDGRWRFPAPGPTRRMVVDLDRLGDWPGGAEGLLLVPVLARLRGELELWVESGFRRLRRCERPRCSNFYRAMRMAGRQSFCSATCRASAAREGPE